MAATLPIERDQHAYSDIRSLRNCFLLRRTWTYRYQIRLFAVGPSDLSLEGSIWRVLSILKSALPAPLSVSSRRSGRTHPRRVLSPVMSTYVLALGIGMTRPPGVTLALPRNTVNIERGMYFVVNHQHKLGD
ncbi:hypothetical protein K466DRAFT_146860 [Polyporus arcularius HHB13444]|uniref:Uncharacterized protein n=1 Tax=Polyporus arcularius HHB13444 TaxID=1314778 RepID=A0A5C3PBA3_9APHY|nr:hypothetical protein K466DRAFT_146860 [Polyporus arcularius HHB13444]